MENKIQELFLLALKIQMGNEGENGYPYVSTTATNFGSLFTVWIMDNGFDALAEYDGLYSFSKEIINEDLFRQCKHHLETLIKREKLCTSE